jgi:hypothetical protein
MWNTFDVNVMVNGNRCKQYTHEGRTYIEAKDGSEWYFQIQNNYSNRILAVCSVDSLNVLTGETATPNDTGYVIDAYHSQKIKGFRFSDDEWALFKFGYKLNGKTYAQSKGDGSERNCGVIGVRLFYEKPPKVEYIPEPRNHWLTGTILAPGRCSGSSWSNYATSGDSQVNWTVNGTTTAGAGGLYGEGKFGYTPESLDSTLDNRFNRRNMTEDHYTPVRTTSYNSYTQPRGFDLGTEWGKREKSKVQTVDFERGCEAQSTDIYYASRESLIQMGVPIGNNLKVNIPKSFPNKYVQPPIGWQG